MSDPSLACCLTAYPHPESQLGMLCTLYGLDVRLWRARFRDSALDGAPWAIGYGYEGPEITRDTVWTQAQADIAR